MNRPIILDVHAWFGPRFPKPEHCPRCHSRDFVPICYGHANQEVMARAEAGEIALGGCTLGAPKWYCRSCRHRWPKERMRPTQEEYLAFRLRCQRYRRRPDVFLRVLARNVRWWCVQFIERHVRIPLLVRQGSIHRKIKLKDGGFQFIVEFPGGMVRVRPSSRDASGLEASCLRGTLAGTRENERLKAAALQLVMKEPS